ncbi:DUF1636 family protein [Amaricoccus solimangrovi]|uniref:DUF1636 domain-containing protein n=1 Tax=Amaricoccus solimangrovi TaxID=2589815 RepID=A0A501WUT1_9RHOB|nr:DUF1636 domain-containing protein [Amaricoccus solimangrovi]TPE53503.1 DUF1636 domain-containing protein [Amaricoccus solimangrovi]
MDGRDGTLVETGAEAEGDLATLSVCVTCRRADAPPGDRRPGAAMLDALSGGPAPEGVRIRAVECLSACSNGCAVALSAPGRWTYVYGNLDPARDAPDILAGAAAYAATPDGLIPWRERPLVLRRNAIARVPPL